MAEVRYECRAAMQGMDALHRAKLMEDLLTARLERKYRRVVAQWEESRRDWNEVLYRMTAYAMGAPRNSAPAERLAKSVTYLMCLKERNSRRRVEALLLGASGLLGGDYYDDYLLGLQEEYAYLANKYSLRPMTATEWVKGRMMPAADPVVRLAQMAALLCKEEYSVDGLIGLRSIEDVERFFRVDMGDYWSGRVAGEDGHGPKGIGRSKVYMLAINLVVPVQFAYATVMGDDGLKEQAMDLLESIPAESNRLVSRWTGDGVPCGSAYDSQALIELSHLCDEGGCERCPLGGRSVK